KSRLTGGLTAGVGHGVAITDIALNLEPLDLDLVRELLGDSIPRKVWQGTLTGSIRGRGGPLDALRVDNAQVTFVDRRANGAISHASFSGQLDLARKSVLHGFDVRLQDLDIRTLGAVNRAADSLHGFLTGRVVLEGPTRDLAFHDLDLTHVDGDFPRSHVRGQGRLATDVNTRWLDATLSLDTIALATLARGRTSFPLRGILRGTLELHATRDTMSIDAKLRAGEGTVTFTGASLLDSVRTWLRGSATLQAFDPRVLISRKEIPFLRLDGTALVQLDGHARRTEGHVDIALDSTSRIGDSRLTFARVRSGVDSTGFHVDTAEVHAVDWRVSARGSLARTGVTSDTLRFKAEFDSLTALRSIVLDSTGASLADSLHGAATAAGVLVGSLDTLALTADFGVRNGRYGSLTIRRASGHAALERLPSAATGVLAFTADSAAYGSFAASRVQARADVRGGRTGHVTADIASSDTVSTRFVADLQRDADSTRIAVDSLGLTLGASRWSLLRPARLVSSPRGVTVDSTTFRSARGATVTLRATVPQAGPAVGVLRLDGLAPADLAFFNPFSPDLDGRFRASATLTGTRDAPHIAFSAGFDSVTMGGTAAPSMTATGTYENKRLKVDARGIGQQREMVRVTGDLPIDLSLRSVPKRLLDDSLSVKINADSATLVGLEAVLPGVEGLKGTFSANMDVRGTWKQVSGTGTVGVRGGEFFLARYGTVGRGMVMDDTLSRDSLRIHLHVSDGEGRANAMSVDGLLWIEKQRWLSNLTSIGRNFRVVDDPRFATAIANWLVHLTGPLRSPALDGDAALLTASLVMDQTRTVRTLRSDSAFAEARLAFKQTNISSLRVLLGNDVRLKSKAANVHLTGEVELSGTMANPYVDGEIYADRGTYLVDLGPLKRTFRVDSGTVRVAGRRDIPAIIDLWTSYIVRGVQGLAQQDITITAHLTGTSDHPSLALASSDLGTAVAQSELISYLIFGAPSFANGGQGISIQGSATAVLVPSLGGVVEGFLGSVFPFFSSLQVTTVAGNGPQNLTTNPLDGLLNGFALTGGRQLGNESWLTLSGGVCGGSRLASTQSPPGWGSVSAEYRPKNKLSAVASFEPVGSACNGVGRYQFGLDLFRDWKY
ncbi:MAG TPA: translocation/assembly module TamB domain-containing protein, partial [Gemmatimonadaceae bacterium]|nr:translocation/assembly module TamB domain-containing protein [Gemmatimonadaceae bacterium]